MKYGKIDIQWLGHATFLVKNSVIIYTDPYVLSDTMPKADIILVSHDHYDHCDSEKIKEIQKEDTVIICTTACGRKLVGKTQLISAGKTLEVRGVKIKAVPAYNINKSYHPRGLGVGFVFTLDGTTIYHAGDTDFVPEMKDIHTDIALLPIGGIYTMDENEAAKAAEVIKPKIVIPMHYGTLPQTMGNPQKFKELITNPNIEVRILG